MQNARRHPRASVPSPAAAPVPPHVPAIGWDPNSYIVPAADAVNVCSDGRYILGVTANDFFFCQPSVEVQLAHVRRIRQGIRTGTATEVFRNYVADVTVQAPVDDQLEEKSIEDATRLLCQSVIVF